MKNTFALRDLVTPLILQKLEDLKKSDNWKDFSYLFEGISDRSIEVEHGGGTNLSFEVFSNTKGDQSEGDKMLSTIMTIELKEKVGEFIRIMAFQYFRKDDSSPSLFSISPQATIEHIQYHHLEIKERWGCIVLSLEHDQGKKLTFQDVLRNI